MNGGRFTFEIMFKFIKTVSYGTTDIVYKFPEDKKIEIIVVYRSYTLICTCTLHMHKIPLGT